MVNIIRDEADRAVRKRELHSTGMRAAESAHIPITTRHAIDSAWGETSPIPIDLNPSHCPVALRHPRCADAVDRRGLANKKCVACAIRDFFHLHPAARIGGSPKDAKAISRVVAVHFLAPRCV